MKLVTGETMCDVDGCSSTNSDHAITTYPNGTQLCEFHTYLSKEVGATEKSSKEDDILKILREVMTWIDNWEPDFTDDPDWELLERRVKRLLKGK